MATRTVVSIALASWSFGAGRSGRIEWGWLARRKAKVGWVDS
jgi:hypothetical protein